MALTLLLPLLALLSCISPSAASIQLESNLFNVDGTQAEVVSNASLWHRSKRASPTLSPGWIGTSSFALAGVSGVSAMQISVLDDNNIIIFDKAESNALKLPNGRSAWAAMYRISDASVRPLSLITNSFCAGGGWLGNGTMVSVGGNPREGWPGTEGVNNGLMAIRLITPGADASVATILEVPARLHLTSSRWYASTVRLTDGSLMILGGMTAGGFNNQPTTDNPTFEFFPPKFDGSQIYSKFLHDALNTNLFPIVYSLPNGRVFVAANHLTMIYDWNRNTERRLPNLPIRPNYPSSATSTLLPLRPANKFTPEVLFCGGSTLDSDSSQYWQLDSQSPASKVCARMTLSESGIAGGWKIENMPTARLMGDAVLTPDGNVVIFNGAGSGLGGYGNLKNLVGASNADHPVLQPVLYTTSNKQGKRFSSNFPSSTIERLYHSSATLIPDGRIFISGSNPNGNVIATKYATRYEVEMFSPPYMAMKRPSFSKRPINILYGASYKMIVKLPPGSTVVQAVIMDVGYSTHGVHMNNRLVELVASFDGGKHLTITGPSTPGIYPPGYAWIFVLADGVPSRGYRVMIGDGTGPPVSATALANLLAKTKNLPDA